MHPSSPWPHAPKHQRRAGVRCCVPSGRCQGARCTTRRRYSSQTEGARCGPNRALGCAEPRRERVAFERSRHLRRRSVPHARQSGPRRPGPPKALETGSAEVHGARQARRSVNQAPRQHRYRRQFHQPRNDQDQPTQCQRPPSTPRSGCTSSTANDSAGRCSTRSHDASNPPRRPTTLCGPNAPLYRPQSNVESGARRANRPSSGEPTTHTDRSTHAASSSRRSQFLHEHEYGSVIPIARKTCIPKQSLSNKSCHDVKVEQSVGQNAPRAWGLQWADKSMPAAESLMIR